MENSLLIIFDEIWPNTLYYNSTGSLAQFFEQILKFVKKSNFNQNQFKLSTQHKYMYNYQKNYKNGEFSLSHF